MTYDDAARYRTLCHITDGFLNPILRAQRHDSVRPGVRADKSRSCRRRWMRGLMLFVRSVESNRAERKKAEEGGERKI
ncbi:hypothetical protein MRX96_009677 [Rhipicephalus microplus]